MAQQHSAGTLARQGFSHGKAPAFLLIEGSSSLRLDMESVLLRRFPSARITRVSFLAKSGVNADSLLQQPYDFVLASCPFVIAEGLAWLQALKSRPNPPMVLVLTARPEIGRKVASEGLADACLRLDASASSLAARLDALLEVRRCQLNHPFALSSWRWLEVLHHSDNAIIYLAENVDGRLAAIKQFYFDVEKMDAALLDDFLLGVRALGLLGHKNLPSIMDCGVSGQSVYIIMEYVPGETLKSRLNAEPLPPLQQRLRWFEEIADALAAIHSLSLVHRDLKTSNLLLRDDDSIVLVDFGMENQLLLEVGFVQANEIYCTPYYVSPERIIGGAADARSDLYALGVILYELLVGSKPYEAASLQGLLLKHMLAPIPTLPEDLFAYQSLLEGLLAKLPEERLNSVSLVVQLLHSLRATKIEA